jgi:hypothetical protein
VAVAAGDLAVSPGEAALHTEAPAETVST